MCPKPQGLLRPRFLPSKTSVPASSTPATRSQALGPVALEPRSPKPDTCYSSIRKLRDDVLFPNVNSNAETSTSFTSNNAIE